MSDDYNPFEPPETDEERRRLLWAENIVRAVERDLEQGPGLHAVRRAWEHADEETKVETRRRWIDLVIEGGER